MNFLTENKIEYYSDLESKIADIMTCLLYTSAKIGKQHIGVKTDLQIIASKTGHILDDNALDFPRLNIG